MIPIKISNVSIYIIKNNAERIRYSLTVYFEFLANLSIYLFIHYVVVLLFQCVHFFMSLKAICLLDKGT